MHHAACNTRTALCHYFPSSAIPLGTLVHSLLPPHNTEATNNHRCHNHNHKKQQQQHGVVVGCNCASRCVSRPIGKGGRFGHWDPGPRSLATCLSMRRYYGCCVLRGLVTNAEFLGSCGMTATIVILGTNHGGAGCGRVMLSRCDVWNTPMGDVEVDCDAVSSLLEFRGAEEFLVVDEQAHQREHSVENQLPMLMVAFERLGRRFRIVPVLVGDLVAVEDALRLAAVLGGWIRSMESSRDSVLVVSTTDFTHAGPAYYEKPEYYHDQLGLTVTEYVRLKDAPVLEAIQAGDPQMIFDRGIQCSMCGMWPTILMVYLSHFLNRGTPQLLFYEAQERDSNCTGFASFKIPTSRTQSYE